MAAAITRAVPPAESAEALLIFWSQAPALEAALTGQPCDATLAGRVEPDHLAGLTPIDDARASAAYRNDAALTLVRRAVLTLADESGERAA